MEDHLASSTMLDEGLIGWEAVGRLFIPETNHQYRDLTDVLFDASVARKDVGWCFFFVRTNAAWC